MLQSTRVSTIQSTGMHTMLMPARRIEEERKPVGSRLALCKQLTWRLGGASSSDSSSDLLQDSTATRTLLLLGHYC